jgi:hypothetical protein
MLTKHTPNTFAGPQKTITPKSEAKALEVIPSTFWGPQKQTHESEADADEAYSEYFRGAPKNHTPKSEAKALEVIPSTFWGTRKPFRQDTGSGAKHPKVNETLSDFEGM